MSAGDDDVRSVRDGVEIIGRLAGAGGWIAGACLLGIVVLVCVEVVARTLLGASTLAADEISGYLNAALVALGLGYALASRSFIRMGVVRDRLRGRVRRVVDAFAALVALAYVITLVVLMAGHVRYSFERGSVSIDVLQTPLYIPQAVVLAGLTVLALVLLAYVVRGGRDLP